MIFRHQLCISATGSLAICQRLPVKRNEPCLDTPSLPSRAPWRGESPSRCAARLASPDATLICHGDFHARRCDMNSKGVVLVLFIPPPLLSFLSYRLSCTWRSVRRRPRGVGAGEGGFGKRLTAKGATRCWSCSAVEREIPSSGRWFMILFLFLLFACCHIFFHLPRTFLNTIHMMIIYHSKTAIIW